MHRDAWPRCPSVAVIGGGIAGLAAAWWLSRHADDAAAPQVTLYERHARPGFVAHSVTLDDSIAPGGVRVDVPIRVFYPGYYPTLIALYAELGVESEPVSYASSFTDAPASAGARPYFRYRNWRRGEASWSYVLPQDVMGAKARAIVAGALRFHHAARRALAAGTLGDESIGRFAERERLPREFVDGLMLPAISTIATCDFESARDFPAAVIADYLARGLAREAVRRARQGADDVAARLVAGIGRVVCGARLAGVRRLGAGEGDAVELRFDDGRTERHDHVVLATQANQALALMGADAHAWPAERRALERFRYRPIEVLMHRDERLLPARRGDWSAVNLYVPPGAAQPESTIWVNAVQPALAGRPDVFQTVHPLRRPRDELVISQAALERPVVDAASQVALADLRALHAEPGRRLWFCGSYAEAGIPLLESAVRSARAAAAQVRAALGAGQPAAAQPAQPAQRATAANNA